MAVEDTVSALEERLGHLVLRNDIDGGYPYRVWIERLRDRGRAAAVRPDYHRRVVDPYIARVPSGETSEEHGSPAAVPAGKGTM